MEVPTLTVPPKIVPNFAAMPNTRQTCDYARYCRRSCGWLDAEEIRFLAARIPLYTFVRGTDLEETFFRILRTRFLSAHPQRIGPALLARWDGDMERAIEVNANLIMTIVSPVPEVSS
jgi:hypothetical protein